MYIKIISPKGMVFEGGEVECVNLRTTSGEISVYADHEELISRIDVGEIAVELASGENRYFAAIEGVVSVKDNHITILVDTALAPDEIDQAVTEEARVAAEQTLARDDLGSEDIARLQSIIAKETVKLGVYARRA